MLKPLPLLALLLTLSFVISPALTDPFSGFEADQLPVPQVDPPVQPAGYAFAIWGLIYAWLVVSAVFGVLRRPDAPGWDDVRKPLIVSLAVGTPWLAIANASAVWATVAIIVMAVFAIAALLETPAADRWWLRTPVAIYAGWLTAASLVSVGSTAAGYGLVWGQIGWAYAAIAGAFVVAYGVQRRVPGAPEYGLTVIWALVGIVVANGMDEVRISALALAGIVILALVAATGAARAARA